MNLSTHFRSISPYVFLFTFFLALTSCSSRTDSIEFDSKTWKNDLSGCKGERLKLKEQIEEIRLQLLQLKEPGIRSLLGRPDAEELLERSNKVYMYFISPGPKCQDSNSNNGQTLFLGVRIDALGKVKEANLVSR